MESSPTLNQISAPAPRLSIIVATWNAARTFERCLLSITGQGFTAWELLIADGASTDGTIDLIRQHATQFSWWQSQKDSGIYDAWNQALANAHGEYVLFLGADDALHSPSVLQRIFDAIGNDDYDLVSSRGLLRDTEGHSLGQSGGPWNHTMMPRRMGIVHPGLLHRRDLFARYGSFDPSLRIVGDLDFLLRLRNDIRALDLPFITVDIQNDGISRRQFWRRLRERRRVHARCPRVGPLRANLYWLDKAWRMPIARTLGLQY